MATLDCQPVEKGTGRLNGLDGLRAIAISGVICYHVAVQHNWSGAALAIANRGEFGVSIFFVLSGYLITWLLLREEAKSGTISLWHFYFRRSFRIIPAAFFYLAVVAALSASGVVSCSSSDLMRAGLFLRNFYPGPPAVTGHFWTLAVEEQFYLLWPLIVAISPRRLRLKLVLTLIVADYLWRVFGQPPSWHLDSIAFRLLTGCLLALILNAARWRSILARPILQSKVIMPLSTVGIVAMLAVPIRAPFWIVQASNLLGCILIAVIIFRVTRADRNQQHRFLDHPFTVWLGRLSYSLYLWQQLFCLTLNFSIALQLLATLLAACVSFYLVERPFLRAREQIERNWFPTKLSEPIAGPLLNPTVT